MTGFARDDYLWAGEPLRGLCGHCQVQVDSTDPNHRVTSVVRGGRGVECVLRGDIRPAEGGPLRAVEAAGDPLADAIDEELARWRIPTQMFVGLSRRYLAEILTRVARRIIEAEVADTPPEYR